MVVPGRGLYPLGRILPLVEYVSFMLSFNRVCDTEKLQKLQNRCLRMCFDIKKTRDKSVKSLHEDANGVSN